ncbi:MAG TPA: class I SAM-dependent methyltransferase [Candidatus Limnocylindrales bacterium]|nr:class I SAM-dependent methyltransferase [Candidatus Limnocylindrales bacterium]
MSALWRNTVRFGFRLLYQEFAFTYDAVSWTVSMGAWRCWVASALKFLPPGEPVLELAHGPGHLQAALAEQGSRAFGIDQSVQMGRQARRRLLKRGRAARLARARAQALPFADETFAAIVSTFPTEFIVQPATLAEVRRVLQPGAPLIIVPAASFNRGGAAKAALEWAYQVTGQRSGRQTVEAGIAL